MKDVDGMKKIRNWIRELQNKVAEEQMPPRYRDLPLSSGKKKGRRAEGAAEPSGDRRRQSGGYCAVSGETSGFF